MDKKVVETRYVHDSWGITICCSRLLHGGVDWNCNNRSNTNGMLMSPPSRRRGLKSFRYFPMFPPLRRLLHGGVDWNINARRFAEIEGIVASFTEAWIEIYICISSFKIKPVASFTEAWIEIGNPHCSSRCCYIVSSQR